MTDGTLFGQSDDDEGGISGELVPYEFPFTGEQVRAGMIDGEPWLLAPDVCMILKHSNVTMAVKGLDEDERQTVHRGSSEALNFPGLFADQRINSVTLINEPGLYSLVLRSKVPAAKAFKKWVAAVLKQIRRTGSYGIPVPRRELSNRELAMMVLAEADRADLAESKVKELTPGHELAQTYAAASGTMTMRAFARTVQQWGRDRKVDVKQEQVFDFLGLIGMVIRSRTSERNQATAHALKAGWAENTTKDYEMPDGELRLSTYAKLTRRGIDHAWKRIHSAIGEFGTLDPKVIRP